MDINTGISIFKHDWAKLEEVEENIFAMVIQAVGNILDGLLKKGNVREIRMDQAVSVLFLLIV